MELHVCELRRSRRRKGLVTLGRYLCATSRFARRQSDWLQLHNSELISMCETFIFVTSALMHSMHVHTETYRESPNPSPCVILCSQMLPKTAPENFTESFSAAEQEVHSQSGLMTAQFFLDCPTLCIAHITTTAIGRLQCSV